MESVFTRSNLIHAISGATGSALSLSLFYPLDSLRTRLQVGDESNPVTMLRQILEKDGIGALYNGWLAVISSIYCSNFVYFYSYTAIQASYPPDSFAPLRDIVSAFLAGTVNVLVTTPLWVANTRLKLGAGPGPGLVACVRSIARSEGLGALWGGTGASLVLAASPAVHFAVYEALKRWGARWLGSAVLPGAFYFAASALAKLVATVCTYPVQVVQSRMRAGVEEDSGRRKRTALWTLRLLLRQGGPLALYKGFETKIAQTVLTTAFMFLFYEKLLLLVRHAAAAAPSSS